MNLIKGKKPRVLIAVILKEGVDSDGTERLKYCTYGNEWGHDTFTC
jgi:hypothetical protein